MVGGLGNAVGADHGVGEQSADRADDDEAAAAALRHAGEGHRGQPQHAFHVGGKDLVESLVRNPGQRSVIGVGRCIRHCDIDSPPPPYRVIDQSLQVFAMGHVARPRQDFEPFAFKFLANLFASLGFSAAKRNPGASARQLFGDRFADATRAAGHQGHLSGEIEQRRHFLFHYVKSDTTKLTGEGVPTEYRNAKHSAAFPTRINGGEAFMGAPEPAAPLSQPAATFSYEHEGDRQFATTLARGLEVLRCFTPLEPLLGNKEISVRTGLPKPTVSRLTYTLTKLGYLRHNMRLGKYQLGSAVLSIGYPLLASMNVRQVARPVMKELADYCNGSVSMGVRDRLNMVYVESCRSGNGITTLPDIGTSVPISHSVIGRAFLAACTPPEREAVLNQMKVKEPEAHRKYRAPIDKSLEDIRARGFCASSGELRREVHAVGVPMRRTVDGEIVAFNCIVPAFMVKKGQLEDDLGPRLVAMVRNIEASLGLH